jgi:hypothetical protein
LTNSNQLIKLVTGRQGKKMSKAVEEQVNQLFEAVKDLSSFEEIKPHCDNFNNWLAENTSYSTKSLGTVFSRAGFYKKFRSLPLQQGKNAELVPKHDANGNVTGNKLEHYVILLCGLKSEDWDTRNSTTRVSDRLENGQEINPDLYLEVTGKLLESHDPHELAVGLIAATGRRPHEILVRAKFTSIKGQDYQVKFSGQGKKRGEIPIFNIATLYPAKYIIEKLNQLRSHYTITQLIADIESQFSNDIAAQNRSVDSRRNQSLNRVVREFFGDKGEANPVLAFRDGEDQDNCKALRAAYLCLATARDCQGSIGAKMLHAAKLAGHFVSGENVTDRDLNNIITTLGYSDYYTTKFIPFTTMPEREKSHQVRAYQSDYEVITQLQKDWNCNNQQEVITKLISDYRNRVEIAKELQELKIENAKLKAELEQVNQELQESKQELETMKTQEFITVSPTDLEALIDRKISEALARVQPTAVIQPQTKPAQTKTNDINFEELTDEELWKNKSKGSSEEKIRRCLVAIKLYNDTVATENSNRLAITNQALRDLSGVNGLIIGDWIKQHSDEIISHNAKYGMENKKDLSNPASYANKGKDIESILKAINSQFLSGVAKV